MQLYLSNLVDLALGKPHYIGCEHYSLLHALLQVILKKTDLSNSRIELTDELAEKAGCLMKLVPALPSISFKDYTIKEDGVKVRKRKAREIGVKRSLTKIKKKWPQCCPSSSKSSATFMIKSSSSASYQSVTPPARKSSYYDEEEKVKTRSSDQEILNVLSLQIKNLEKAFGDFVSEINAQNVQNCAILGDFMKLKNQFEKASPALEQLQNYEEIDFEFLKNQIASRNCEVKVNIRENYEASSDDTSGTTTATCISDEDEENQENHVSSEIKWLKERMLELSDSLKMHSQCLRKLKCDDFTKMKTVVEEVMIILQDMKCQIITHQEMIKSLKCRDVDFHDEFERVNTEIGQLTRQLQEAESKLEVVKQDAETQLTSFRNELEDRNNHDVWSSPTTVSRPSTLVNTQNLQKSDGEKKSLSLESESSTATQSRQRSSKQSSSASQPSMSQKEFSINGDFEAMPCYEIQMDRNGCQIDPPFANYEDQLQMNSNQQQCQQSTNGCGTQFCSCMKQNDYGCPDPYSTGVNNIQKQVSSHDYCLQQLIRDVGSKIDRCEFEMCRRQIDIMTETVIQLKQQVSLPTAAGTSFPLMRNVNCISCQTTTNMSIYAKSMPRAPALKFGRAASNSTDNSCEPSIQSSVNRNWNSYKLNGARRAGGIHTIIPKAIEVRSMRFKRLKTPLKMNSSILIYKNRFRRGQRC